MRAERAEGCPLAHSGRVRMGMKKQITVMSIWLCHFTLTFISFPSASLAIIYPLSFLSHHSSFPLLSLPLTTPTYHTGLGSRKTTSHPEKCRQVKLAKFKVILILLLRFMLFPLGNVLCCRNNTFTHKFNH